MRYFAKVNKKNLVEQVSVFDDAKDSAFVKNFFGGGNWIECYKLDQNNPLKNYPGIGFSWDSENQAFIPPKPYNSWILNSSYVWEAPVALPEDASAPIFTKYIWNEENLSWELCEDCA